MVPAAKYHDVPVLRAHGSTARSSPWTSEWLTTARPPTTSTTTPGSGVARMLATFTRVSSPGATVISREPAAPSPPGITVIVARTSVFDTLPIRIVSSARPPSFDVPSAQYHEVDTASLGGTATSANAALPAPGLAGDESLRPWYTAAATIAPMTTSRIGHRGGPCASGTAAGTRPVAAGVGATWRDLRRGVELVGAAGRRAVGPSGRGSSAVTPAPSRRSRRRPRRARRRARAVPTTLTRRGPFLGIAARAGAGPPHEHDQPDQGHPAEERPALPLVRVLDRHRTGTGDRVAVRPPEGVGGAACRTPSASQSASCASPHSSVPAWATRWSTAPRVGDRCQGGDVGVARLVGTSVPSGTTDRIGAYARFS